MHRFAIALFAIALLTACGSSAAKGIDVTNAYSLSTASSVTNAVVYMNVESRGKADALTGASVDPSIASAASLHQTTTQGMNMAGMDTSEMGMESISSIDLPAGKKVAIKSGGYHVMLDGLTKSLTNGETYKLHLQFKSGQSKDVHVSVRNNE